MKFEEVVRGELKLLNRRQIREFAWRCGVRALPYIAPKDKFQHWPDFAVPVFIYRVMGALDAAYVANAAYVAFLANVENADIALNAYIASYNAAQDSYGTYGDFAAYDEVTNTAAAAANNAAASAAFAAADADVDTYYATEAAVSAEEAEVTYGESGEVMQRLIIQDLQAIKLGKRPAISVEDYENIWPAFQKALIDFGCGYWARLYEKVFENDFEFNLEEAKQRLNLPAEIKDQGAVAVARYMKRFGKEKSRRLNEARIIVLGDKGAGKTCVSRRLVDPKADMTTPEESTAGVDTTTWNLREDDINVRIWDFAGHTVTHAVHQFFLSERCLYIIVLNGRTEQTKRVEYWLEQMKVHGGNSKAIILINERDGHRVGIRENYLRERYSVEDIHSFNVGKDKAKLKVFRTAVAEYIRNNTSWKNQVIPASYYRVKEALEDRFQKGGRRTEHLDKEEFMKLAAEHDVEEPESLLGDLHALGVSLWYKGMPNYDTLILNPEWISHAVYRIINWVNGNKEHSVKLHEFTEIFADDLDRYPKKKHRFIFDLIKHYELAYESKSKHLIIPHLLPEDQPETLPEFGYENSLKLKYQADQPLPPNTVSRFIVRHNEQISKEGRKHLVWKYGVILVDGRGSLALVRELDRTISVSVRGDAKTEFVKELRETLNAIFDSYLSQMPELTYKVIDEMAVRGPELYLPEAEILAHEGNDRPYYDSRNNRDVPLGPTVIHYNINKTTIYNIQAGDIDMAVLGGQHGQITKNTFNFHDCNIELQGNMNDLAQRLSKGGFVEEAEEITEAVEILEEVAKETNKDLVKKKGVASRLKRIVEDLEDKGSQLNKAVKRVKRGIDIAQDIAKGYNSIAQWLGMPQVPKPFLGKK